MVTLDQRRRARFRAGAGGDLPARTFRPNRDGAPRGGVYEASPAGEALMEDVAHAIAARGGGAIIVDYGYDTPGFGETLQAVASHKFADVLADPGASDLSAHVDFRALGDAAVRGGASVLRSGGTGRVPGRLGIAAARAEQAGTEIR